MGSQDQTQTVGETQDTVVDPYKCFCTDSLRVLSGHICSLLDRFGVPVDKGALRQTLTAFLGAIEPDVVRQSMCTLLEKERVSGQCLPEGLAERMAATFVRTLCEAYCTHVGRYLRAVGCAQSLGQAVEDEAQAFGQILLGFLLPLAKAEAMGHEEVRAVQPLGHTLRDAFGRALLSPVEARYPIVDRGSGGRRGTPCFPRLFCAPVLAEIKFRLIGDDKYDSTNAKLISSIEKHCQIEGQLDLSRMREYFMCPVVRQYLLAYSLHLLKHFMGDDRKETFQANVNVRIRKQVLENPLEFGDRHLSILTSSWALFVFDHLDELCGRGAAPRILRHYIPGKMDGIGD